jgi:hypothetical protein
MRERSREIAITVGLVLVAILIVRAVRGDLFATDADIRDKHDVYFLPPPDQVRLMSLGYQHALADVLWAHVMVSQGLHTFERRRFDNLLLLYDAINELDPTWRTPYLMADALITFQSEVTPYEEIVRAREIMERGVKHRPYDAEIWLNLGEFVSFIAPATYLDGRPEEAQRWRIEGAQYLQRAAELAGSNSDISWQALGGASILAKAGELHAALRFWERTRDVTDDDELKAEIQKKIDHYAAQLGDEKERLAHEIDKRRDEVVTRMLKTELPFLSPDPFTLLGPPPHPARCAGLEASASARQNDDPACATTWHEWNRRYQERARGGT